MSLRLALLVSVLVAAPSLAQEESAPEVSSLRSAFEYGKYAEVLERAGGRIDRGALSEGELVELHKLAGLSAFNLGKQDSASRHFRALLRLEPDYSLDPFVVPPPAIRSFDDLKARMATELELIRQEKRLRLDRERAQSAQLEKERTAAEEQRRRLERLAELGSKVEKRSFLVNFLPFGAGQFHQGRRGLGVAFAAVEGVLALTSIAAFFMYDSFFVRESFTLNDRLTETGSQTVEVRYIPTEDVGRARAWSYIKWGSGGAFYAVFALGVVDALYHHQDEVRLKLATGAPEEAGPSAKFHLFPTPGGLGAGVRLRF